MRGRIAAACAAVLVGLAPPGALACAPWLGPDAWAAAPVASARAARHLASAIPQIPERAAAALPAFPPVAGAPSAAAIEPLAPSIWRSPSGPAPSQAPPLA